MVHSRFGFDVKKSAFESWGEGSIAQMVYVDRYEDELPTGWDNDRSFFIQGLAEVQFKPQIVVTLHLQNDYNETINVKVKPDRPMPELEMPQRFGYVFKGIFSEPNGSGLQYYAAKLQSARDWKIADTPELYVYWEASRSVLTLDTGTETVNVTAICGSPMPAAELPSRLGYHFNGFYFAETDGSQTFYYNANMGSVRNWDKMGDITLYADWNPVTYTITYANLQGGTNPTVNPTSYTIESEKITFLSPSRVGYLGTFNPAEIMAGSVGDKTVTASSIEYKI